MIFDVFHGIGGLFQDLVSALLDGVLYLDVRSRDKNVNQIHVGIKTAIDILLDDPRQTANFNVETLVGDHLDRFKFTFRRYRKTGLDDVHTEFVKLSGDSDLFVRGQRDAGCLFTITKGRIENLDFFFTQCFDAIENDPTQRTLVS